MPAASNRQKYIFGLCSISIFLRTPAGGFGKLIATIDQATSATLEDTTEVVQAPPGGCSRYSQDAQTGAGEATLTVEFNKLALGLFEGTKGAAVTEQAADSTGDVTGTFTNTVGTSISADITAVALTASKGDLVPHGIITVRAKTTTTVDIYSSHYAEPVVKDLTIVTGANVIALLGITLTGDASIALVPGDEAYVFARPSDSERTTLAITGNEKAKEVILLISGQELAQGELFNMIIYKAICPNLGIPITAKEHATWSLEFAVLQPPANQNMYLLEWLTRA